jgi:hypothetical protein
MPPPPGPPPPAPPVVEEYTDLEASLAYRQLSLDCLRAEGHVPFTYHVQCDKEGRPMFPTEVREVLLHHPTYT